MTLTKVLRPAIIIGITALLFISCNKEEDDEYGAGFPHTWSSADVSILGAINGDFSLNEEGYFSSVPGDSVYLGASQNGKTKYTIFVNVDLNGIIDSAMSPPCQMVIIDFDGFKKHNYVKFRQHGSPDIDYIIQTGKIEIYFLNYDFFEGSIDAALKNANGDEINMKGHLKAFHGI